MGKVVTFLLLLFASTTYSQTLPDLDVLNGFEFVWEPGNEGLDEEEVYELMESTQEKVNRYILINQFFGPDYIYAICSIFSLKAFYGNDLNEPVGYNADPRKEALLRTLPINNRTGDELESTFDRELMKYVEQVVLYSETSLDYGGELILNDEAVKHYLVPENHGGDIPEEGGLIALLREIEVSNRSHTGRYGQTPSYSEHSGDLNGNNTSAIRDLSNVFMLFNEIRNGKYTEYFNQIVQLVAGGGQIDQDAFDEELLDISDVFEQEVNSQGFEMDFETMIDAVYENMSEEEAAELKFIIEELYNNEG